MGECEQLEHDVQEELSQWTEHTDESGKRFSGTQWRRRARGLIPVPRSATFLTSGRKQSDFLEEIAEQQTLGRQSDQKLKLEDLNRLDATFGTCLAREPAAAAGRHL